MMLSYCDRLCLSLQRHYNLDALRRRIPRLPVPGVGNRQGRGRAVYYSPYIPGIPYTATWPLPILIFERIMYKYQIFNVELVF